MGTFKSISTPISKDGRCSGRHTVQTVVCAIHFRGSETQIHELSGTVRVGENRHSDYELTLESVGDMLNGLNPGIRRLAPSLKVVTPCKNEPGPFPLTSPIGHSEPFWNSYWKVFRTG